LADTIFLNKFFIRLNLTGAFMVYNKIETCKSRDFPVRNCASERLVFAWHRFFSLQRISSSSHPPPRPSYVPVTCLLSLSAPYRPFAGCPSPPHSSIQSISNHLLPTPGPHLLAAQRFALASNLKQYSNSILAGRQYNTEKISTL
jgi:hypothetical protein